VRSGLETTALVANSSGFLSFFLLWLAVVWGIVLRNGWASTRIRHVTAYGIHQTVALLGLTLGAVHAVVVESGRGEQVRWVDAFVPFASYLRILGSSERFFYDVDTTEVDRFGLGVGVLGLELMIAAAVSTLIQRRIGYSRWRGLHSLTYAAFSLVVVHIMMTGPDAGPVWMWASVAGCWLSTLALWLAAPALMAIAEGPIGRSLALGARRKPAMVVNVDARLCGRSGFCTQAAPEIFRLHNDGRLSYRASVDFDETEAVTRAAELCPVRAISLGLAPTAATRAPLVPADDTGAARPTSATGLDNRRRAG
jgi:ferredoxin/DMSO/TMAO reductase YedYZ heme-binding membrane subunit